MSQGRTFSVFTERKLGRGLCSAVVFDKLLKDNLFFKIVKQNSDFLISTNACEHTQSWLIN